MHYYQESLNTSREIGDRRILIASLDGLGKTHLKQGELDLAHGYLSEATQNAQQAGLLPQLLDSLASMGLLHLKNRVTDSAFQILTAVLHHPTCPAHVKKDTAAALNEAGVTFHLDEANCLKKDLPNMEDIVKLALETHTIE